MPFYSIAMSQYCSVDTPGAGPNGGIVQGELASSRSACLYQLAENAVEEIAV
jgi:hypothetical protein